VKSSKAKHPLKSHEGPKNDTIEDRPKDLQEHTINNVNESLQEGYRRHLRDDHSLCLKKNDEIDYESNQDTDEKENQELCKRDLKEESKGKKRSMDDGNADIPKNLEVDVVTKYLEEVRKEIREGREEDHKDDQKYFPSGETNPSLVSEDLGLHHWIFGISGPEHYRPCVGRK
jgi:hypothetical protein